MASSTDVPTSDAGSVGATPNNNVRIARPTKPEATSPAARPTARDHDPLGHDQQQHRAIRRAQRHSHADLIAAQRDGVGDDAVRAKAGQQEREHGEAREQHRAEFSHGDRHADDLFETSDFRHRHGAIERGDLAAKGRNQRERIAVRADDQRHVLRPVVGVLGRLAVREIHRRLRRIAEAARLDVADDADHRESETESAPRRNRFPIAFCPGHSARASFFAHDHYRLRAVAVAAVEVTSGDALGFPPRRSSRASPAAELPAATARRDNFRPRVGIPTDRPMPTTGSHPAAPATRTPGIVRTRVINCS